MANLDISDKSKDESKKGDAEEDEEDSSSSKGKKGKKAKAKGAFALFAVLSSGVIVLTCYRRG